MLASASFDKTISIIDCRNGSLLQPVPLPADVESLAWDPFQSNHLYCSMEDGQVMCVDIRKLSSTTATTTTSHKSRPPKDAILFQFFAHDKTVSSLDFSSSVPGLCATSSIDETVKIWDMHTMSTIPSGTNGGPSPRNIFYKSMNVGNLFSINFSKDEPFLLATGGDSGIVAVWDCDEQQIIKDYFEGRNQSKPSPYTSLTVGSSADATSNSDLKLENIEEEDGMELVGEKVEKDGKKKKKKPKKKSA
jgi:periodic tryptophan protein 1